MARIRDLLAVQRTVSFEFFPPKSIEAAVQLTNTMTALSQQRPDFVSITYGAGGSDRERTVDTVVAIERERQTSAMAHLTCIGHSVAEVDALLDSYAAAGVENILALGGDAPAVDGVVPTDPPPLGDFRYASDLVAHVKEDGRFSVGVAAHPEGHPRSRNRAADRKHLARKLNEADFAITQFFFEIDDYLSMVNDLADYGCDKPVIPGVIPLTNANQVSRFAAMAGATIPAALVAQIDAAVVDGGTPGCAQVFDLGVEVAQKLSQDLMAEGAPGLHYYTLNKAPATIAILDELAIPISS